MTDYKYCSNCSHIAGVHVMEGDKRCTIIGCKCKGYIYITTSCIHPEIKQDAQTGDHAWCVRCGIHLKFDGSGYIPIDSRISTTGKEIDPNGINHPSHYNKHPSGVECIDIIRHHNFNVGSTIKYLWRAGLKENESNLKDLKKALWYLQDEIVREEKRNAPKND